MFNASIVELNIKLSKTDYAYSVFAQSRSRELIGIQDNKYFAVYKNDKGALSKMFMLTLASFDITWSPSSIIYF